MECNKLKILSDIAQQFARSPLEIKNGIVIIIISANCINHLPTFRLKSGYSSNTTETSDYSIQVTKEALFFIFFYHKCIFKLASEPYQMPPLGVFQLLWPFFRDTALI